MFPNNILQKWLPEPVHPDETYADRGEHPLDWLERSTLPRAQACRQFLNQNLAKLPLEAQNTIRHAARNRWESAFFELIVARVLQELGAHLDIETPTATGKRPDFTAQFADGSVIVEAISPIFNASASEESKNHIPLLDFIESKIPLGWQIGVFELPRSGTGTKALEDGVQLIFGRTFEGWTGPGRIYYELHQEYAHLTDIHWRPEKRAYCHFNAHGDLEPVVSVTTREDEGGNVALVSFKWEPLEEYLAASNASLVRMFDFTLFRRLEFNGWSNEPPQKFHDSDHFFYRRKVMPDNAAYTRGVQIIHSRRPEKAVFTNVTNRWGGKKNKEYVEFIAYDWRNSRIAKISTNPSATANYFNAEGNSLPFELSPAFFRPEVLLKYKADRDKYTVGERDVSCRTAWHLEGIDVNEAGQVHAYICYLRRLPHAEQLHWLSFNEPPKADISKRAFINDFKGGWTTFTEPLQKVLSVIRRWHNNKVTWWTLRDEKLLDRVNTPLTESRDEWAEAFMDLAKLVVEGFETKPIRVKLDTVQVSYEKEDRTIALLEKLLNKGNLSGEEQKLVGLRTAQLLRSKAKGHASGSEAEQLAQGALIEHETFGNHFRYVCAQVADELEIIEQLIS